MRMTLKEAIDSILKIAPSILEEDKYHAPILFVFGEKENAAALIELRDPVAKHKSMRAAGRKMAYLRPYCVAFVSEAWMVKQMPPDGRRVSEMPDKEECLVVAAQSKTGETECSAIPFSRVGGEVILGETIHAPEVEAYLLELFWEGAKEKE